MMEAWNKYNETGLIPLPDGRIDYAVPHLIRLAGYASRRDKRTGGMYGGYGVEREFHDAVLDGIGILEHWPQAFELYSRMRESAQKIVAYDGDHVDFSPHLKSCMTLKSYDKPGDEHGWHVETNGLTVICCVQGVANLHVMPLGATGPGPDHYEITMLPGHAYLLRGHDLWHRVPPVKEVPRTTLVMNFYLNGDFSRPEGLDEQHYA